MNNGVINENMRRVFADELYKAMGKDSSIWVIAGDLGYKMWDQIRADFPERFINVGSAEQLMMGVGVGLALEGKKPFVFSITTFLLYRPFEIIRNYINHEKIPVRLVGSGRGKDYSHDGISHWPLEDESIMQIFSNIDSRWPDSSNEISELVSQMVNCDKPWYINLKR